MKKIPYLITSTRMQKALIWTLAPDDMNAIADGRFLATEALFDCHRWETQDVNWQVEPHWVSNQLPKEGEGIFTGGNYGVFIEWSSELLDKDFPPDDAEEQDEEVFVRPSDLIDYLSQLDDTEVITIETISSFFEDFLDER